jgi:hypothetical protein
MVDIVRLSPLLQMVQQGLTIRNGLPCMLVALGSYVKPEMLVLPPTRPTATDGTVRDREGTDPGGERPEWVTELTACR